MDWGEKVAIKTWHTLIMVPNFINVKMKKTIWVLELMKHNFFPQKHPFLSQPFIPTLNESWQSVDPHNICLHCSLTVVSLPSPTCPHSTNLKIPILFASPSIKCQASFLVSEILREWISISFCTFQSALYSVGPSDWLICQCKHGLAPCTSRDYYYKEQKLALPV